MKNKLPRYLYGSCLLTLTLFLAMVPTISAQSNPVSIKTNSTKVDSPSYQFPAAYYNSSSTVFGEQIDGIGEVTIGAIDPSTFIIPNTSTSNAPQSTEATVVYDNGPHINMPGNPDLSLLESVELEMSTLGANIANDSGYGVADDFELVAETEITSIAVYAYQTGATSTTINEMYVVIWDGDPSDGASSVIWGNNTTNVFDSVEDSGVYRVSETTLEDRSRFLQKVNAEISGLTLDAGTYWLEYSLGGSSASGPWQPAISIMGEATTGDALQLTPDGWQAWLDTGSNTPQGPPFQIEGIASSGGAPCSQGTASNGIENGWGNVSLLIYANDFVVAEGDTFTLEEMTVNFLLNPGFDILSADIFFYEDTDGSGPGTEVPDTSSLGVVPNSQNIIGDHPNGFDVIEGIWTLDTPITFEGGASGETVYWMGMQIEYTGVASYLETSSIYNTPNESYFSEDQGATWVSGLANFGDDMHGVITFSGQCEITDVGDYTYCIPEGTNSNRFIDNFSTTGGSENISNMDSGFSTEGYGDFYDTLTVTQEHGETVEFSADIEGGTAGFRVWVDWNQDGVFDTTEEVAYASSSYGNNHTGSFIVPADALEGDTRMRIVSHWLSTSGDIDPCATGFTYGEFEDYKFTVGVSPGDSHAYCIPEGTNASRFINNFSTIGGSENISNMDSGFSPEGYGDFYDTHSIIQEQGEDVEFSVDIEGGTAGFRVWVDWNQDGVFDETEEVAYSSSSYGNNHTGSFTVPADALEGDTRMRIVSHWLSTSGDIDPCATGFTYGEFEDYKFTVEPTLGIDDQSSTSFSYYPNPTNGVVNIAANKDISSVAVFNILGQQVLKRDHLERGQVNLSDLSTGTYIFRVMFEDGGIETFKVLKE